MAGRALGRLVMLLSVSEVAAHGPHGGGMPMFSLARENAVALAIAAVFVASTAAAAPSTTDELGDQLREDHMKGL